MADYTMALRTIVEQTYINKYKTESNLKPMDTIKLVWSEIFDFNFPIYDESVRKDLCCNWLLHFYFNEIGLETYGRWKTCLESRFLDIMPYINDMASNQILIQDMYNDRKGTKTEKWDLNRKGTSDNEYNRNSSTESDTTNNTDTTSNTQTTNHSESVDYLRHSETPQNGLEDIQAGRYLTSADVNNNETDSNGIASASGNSETTGHTETGLTDKTTDNTNSNLDELGNREITEKYQTIPSVDIYGKYREVYFNILKELYRQTADLFITIY